MLQNLKKLVENLQAKQYPQSMQQDIESLHKLLQQKQITQLSSVKLHLDNIKTFWDKEDNQSLINVSSYKQQLEQIITLLKPLSEDSNNLTKDIKTLASNYLEKGKSLYNNDNIQAIKHLNTTIILGVENQIIADASYYKGLSLYALHKYPEAMGCFHSIINQYSTYSQVAAAYHYKGQCLYNLKKYAGAIGCFEEVIKSESSLKICAYLYKGLCHEALEQYSDAIEALSEVRKFKGNSGYGSGEESIINMAERALKTNIIKHFNFEMLIKFFPEIDKPDELGKTLLMYAAEAHDTKIAEKLLEKGADPFKTDNSSNSALSIAFRNNYENLAKQFLEKKLADVNTSSKHEIQQIKKELNKINPEKEASKLSHYIVEHIKTQDFSEFLGLNNKAVEMCYAEAKNYCDILGVTEDFQSYNM